MPACTNSSWKPGPLGRTALALGQSTRPQGFLGIRSHLPAEKATDNSLPRPLFPRTSEQLHSSPACQPKTAPNVGSPFTTSTPSPCLVTQEQHDLT